MKLIFNVLLLIFLDIVIQNIDNTLRYTLLIICVVGSVLILLFSNNNIKGTLLDYLKKNKPLLITTVILAPFFLIPLVAIATQLCISICTVLRIPAVLTINIEESLKIADYIYYYTCFLSIEVTAIFSYAVFELTKKANEIAFHSNLFQEKNKQIQEENMKKIAFNKALELQSELEENYTQYLDHLQKYSKYEKENLKSKYFRGEDYFEIQNWKNMKSDIFSLDIHLGKKIDSVYKKFEVLIGYANYLDKFDFDKFDLDSFEKEYNELIDFFNK